MKLAITYLWILLIHAFVIPMMLYGHAMVPEVFDVRYAYQIFLALITPICIVAIIDLVFPDTMTYERYWIDLALEKYYERNPVSENGKRRRVNKRREASSLS